MGQKSKVILGLKRKWRHFRESEKVEIVEDYLRSDLSKRAIWEKHTGQVEEHGQILRWMRELGYIDFEERKISTLAKTKKPMKKKLTTQGEDFETVLLKKRISELEKQVKESELKAIAFSTMVDIAEREFGISIRKKYNTKPSDQ